MNTAGVRLTCADTIKNSLFQRYIDLLRHDGLAEDTAQAKATEFYRKSWDSIFSDNQDSVTYWNSKRQVGRLFRDNIEILLHCMINLKITKIPNPIRLIIHSISPSPNNSI